MSSRLRGRLAVGALVWTAVAVVAAVAIAGLAAVRLYDGEQACFFQYPSIPCPTGADLLPVAFFVVPGVWLAGIAVVALAAIRGRRRDAGR